MNNTPVSSVDSEESALFDESTAPTTPDGSLTFSPVLQALRATDALEMDAIASLSALQPPSAAAQESHVVPVQARNICCVGAGYVGGPTAAVIALHNPSIRVTVVDRDETKIRRWNSRHPPIYEPQLREVVRVARDGARQTSFSNAPARPTELSASDTSECGSQCETPAAEITVPSREPNLFFSTEVGRCIGEADLVLVAVNTPTKARGIGAGSATDMASFEAVMTEVAKHAKPGAIIVEKSTVPCRTAELVRETMSLHRPNLPFEILSNPEFLAAGTAISDLLQPDRVLIGCSPTHSGHAAASALASVYSWVSPSRIITTNVYSSELAKLVANALLAQRISSINAVSAICERTGADVSEVAACVGRDARIGSSFLRAGIGFGGSCFRKDVLSLVYLAESLGLPEVGTYWRQVVEMNEFQRERFARNVIARLNNTLRGKKIVVLGYAFKKDTSDTRESPALGIIRTLLEEGPREIAVFDPACNPEVIRDEVAQLLGRDSIAANGGPLVVYGNAYEACHNGDAVIIATEFDEFRTPTPTPEARISKPSALDIGQAGAQHNKIKGSDPRPFNDAFVSETNLLVLHQSLSRDRRTSSYLTSDPLGRFHPEPQCEPGCPDCVGREPGRYRAGERLDWAKIAYHMREPKWVFDGRGVVDPDQLAKFGVRVESVGRQSRW